MLRDCGWALCWTLKPLISFKPRSSWAGLAPLSPSRDAHRGSRQRSAPPGDAQVSAWPSAVSPLHPGSPPLALRPHCPLLPHFYSRVK